MTGHKRYQIDERTGCIAVVDTQHPSYKDRSQGLHPQDEYVIYFRNGRKETAVGRKGFYIPESVKRESFAALNAANDSEDMADCLRHMHENYIKLAVKLHGLEKFREDTNRRLSDISLICDDGTFKKSDPRYS